MRAAFRLARPEPPESAILCAILHALQRHPAVAAAWRQNTGAMSTARAFRAEITPARCFFD
jgi:hypothetical protein